MANTSIALMTQSLSKLPLALADPVSAQGGAFGVSTSPNDLEASSLDFSSNDNQFSLLLSEASAGARPTLMSHGQGTAQPVDSSDVIMPPPHQTDAYDLVTLDGKELPFLGNFMPQATIEEDFPDLANVGFAKGKNRVVNIDSETSQISVGTASDKSTVREDIALWLSDPELSFIGPSTAVPNDSGDLSNFAGSASQASQLEIVNSPIAPNSVVEDKLGEISATTDTTNPMIRKSNPLVDALSELAAEIEKRAALNEIATESDGEAVDTFKSPSNQAKSTASVPVQLFPEQVFGNEARDATKETRIAVRMAENLNDSRQMDRTASAMTENFNAATVNAAETISLNNGRATNSVDSFVNVLLNIDTSTQSNSSIAPALDQWKAEQASRSAIPELADPTVKSSFSKLSTPMGQTGWGENLGRQLSTLMARNLDSAQIQLDPPELGPLQVKIQVNNDQVSLHFTTAHGVVKEALEASSARLQEMFQDEGMELANLDVSDQSANEQDSRGAQSQDLRSNGARNDPSAEPDQSDGKLTLSAQWQQDDGKIDYFI